MINPRLAALAEIAWSSKAKRTWSQFRSSLIKNMEYMTKMGWKFHSF
jgi:N-acetyl-beta-hexosaminidase